MHKIDELEGLRGIMAWWVVVGHLLQTLNLDLPLLSRNTLAVDVFIIISGFVISYLMAARREAYGPYILRRGFRLFPLYLVILAVSTATLPLAGYAIAGLPFGGSHNVGRLELVQAALQHPISHIAAHLVLAQGIVPEWILPHAPYTLVGQAWSISLEWQFYLVAPLIALLCSHAAGRVAFVAIAVATAVMPQWIGDAFLLDRLGYFAVGIGSFWLFRAVSHDRRLAPVPLIVAVAALLTTLATRSVAMVPLLLWSVTLACAESFDLRGRLGLLRRFLVHPAVLSEGRRSYSLYMVHMLMLWAAAGLLTPWIGDRTGLALAIAGITVLASMMMSRWTYRWIELPGIALGSRIVRGQAARVPAP